MDFKNLEEAKQYIEAKDKELESIKKQLEDLTKNGLELKAKNDELVKTNSKLLGDIVNMSNSKEDGKKEEENKIPDKDSFFNLTEEKQDEEKLQN